MRRSIPLWSVALAAAPFAMSHVDSSVTDLRIAGGKGSYAYITRGCDNSVISREKIDYDNVGAEASHKFTGPFRIGVRAGEVRPQASGRYYYEPSSNVHYVNPFLSLDWHGFSMGGGYVRADHHFPEEDFSETGSGHIRIGNKFYYEISFMEGVPVTAAGYAQTGFGWRFPKADLWLGVGAVPHDKFGFVARSEYRLADRLGLGGTLRLGSSEGVSENGFAFSLSYRFTNRRVREIAAPPSSGRGQEPAPDRADSLGTGAAPAAPPDSATAPAASDSVRSPRRGRSRALRGRRSRRAPC